MNKLNIFNTHWSPWKYPSNWASNFRVFFRQFKWAYQRVTRGYCDYDWWDADTYLTQLFIDILKEFINHGNSYPGTDEFPTFELWTNYLQEIVNLFEYSLGELPNEYEEAWLKKWENKDLDFFNKPETPEEKEITNKYLDIEMKNELSKQDALKKGLEKFIYIFPTLWD